jgi:hypothetical protein
VFHMDVAKVDQVVAYAASVSETCCKCLFVVFQTYVTSVLIWMLHMLQDMFQMFQLFHSYVAVSILRCKSFL